MATKPISIDELTRAFGRPMDPNAQLVQEIAQRRVPSAQPAPQMSTRGLITPPPEAAPEQARGGLLGQLFGAPGSDQRLKLKMGLMGLTHKPNQQLMDMWGGELQQNQQQAAEAEKVNRTAQYLRSLGTPQAEQAAAALEAGSIDANTAYQMATQQAPAVDPWAGTKEIDGKLYRMGPNGPELVIGGGDNPAITGDQLTSLNTIRDDLRTELAPFEIVKQGYNNITTFYNDPTAVSDYAMAVAFAKILDPGSVAREGEVAAVQGAGAKVPALGQALKNAITGEGQLTPETRNQIATLAAKIYAERAAEAQAKVGSYTEMAKRAGLPAEYVYTGTAIEMGQMPAPLAAPPVPPEFGITQEDWQLDWAEMTEAERQEFIGGNR